MSLIIGIGSNLGERHLFLSKAITSLAQRLALVEVSSVYQSKAIEYSNQPDFLNQVLEFEIPKNLKPSEVLKITMAIELDLGRNRIINKGPRNIDIDLIFWGLEKISTDSLTIPHPGALSRSFVVKPLRELPFFSTLEQHFEFPKAFNVDATILK